MAVHPAQWFRHLPRRRRRQLVLGSAALVLVLLAGVSIYRAATDPIVKGGSSDTAGLPNSGVDGITPEQLLGPLAGGSEAGRYGPRIASPMGRHTVTITITSNVPPTAAGYQTIDGRKVYFEPSTSSSATFEIEGQSPLMVAAAQGGPGATNVECSTEVDGRNVDSFSATGPYGFVVCFA